MLKVLMPAAGFGKRNPQWPIKELMVREGHPLIQYSFELLLQENQSINEVIIITRKEKHDAFGAWIKEFSKQNPSLKVSLVMHEPAPNQEWPATLLAAKPSWGEKNLVLLPDTRLKAKVNLVAWFDQNLKNSKSAWCIFEMDSKKLLSYGNVKIDHGHVVGIVEKPALPVSSWVWGCFGFRRSAGEILLKGLEESTHDHNLYQLEPAPILKLSSFEDLSRQ